MYHVRLFVPSANSQVDTHLASAVGTYVRMAAEFRRPDREFLEFGLVYEFEATHLGLVVDVAEQVSRLLAEPVELTIDGRHFSALGAQAEPAGEESWECAFRESCADREMGVVV